MAQEKSIFELMNSSCRLCMPDYQRGYKWSVGEVRKLLEDVSGFTPDSLPYYCLQNITLVPNGADADGNPIYNVVDGQQRLTTSIVIISYLRRFVDRVDDPDIEVPLLAGKLKYGVRQITDEFLQTEIVSGKIWQETQNAELQDVVWKERMPEEQRTRRLHELFRRRVEIWNGQNEIGRNHQDIFHLYCAAMVVASYFLAESSQNKRLFTRKYLNDVKFIENIVENVSESAIFSKINGLRVPLDGADLLRGIFITNVSRESVDGYGEVEKEIRLNECRVKAGLELDMMNLWWSNLERARYFAYFDTVEDPDGIFDVAKYPINLLYRLDTLSKGRNQILLDFFESPESAADPRHASIAQFEEIKRFHETMKDWYDDKAIYHYVGFLLAQTTIKFRDVYGSWQQERSRQGFYKKLKEWMFDKTFREEGRPNELPARSVRFSDWKHRIVDDRLFNWYENDTDVKRFLILIDVINYAKPVGMDVVNNPLATHMEPLFFDSIKEDKEHIFPQTPIAEEDLRGNENAIRQKMGAYWNLIRLRNTLGLEEKELLERWANHWRNGEDAVIAAEPPFPINGITYDWFRRLIDDENGIRSYVKERINSFVVETCGIDINSLGNIVLLNLQTNRSYGNNFYVDKRTRILADYRNNRSIRLHTRSVFAKEFPLATEDEADDFDAWSQHSILRNREDMAAQLGEFFQEVING